MLFQHSHSTFQLLPDFHSRPEDCPKETAKKVEAFLNETDAGKKLQSQHEDCNTSSYLHLLEFKESTMQCKRT